MQRAEERAAVQEPRDGLLSGRNRLLQEGAVRGAENDVDILSAKDLSDGIKHLADTVTDILTNETGEISAFATALAPAVRSTPAGRTRGRAQ